MIVKKSGGKVYGAILTSDEKKAMNMEIQRQMAEYDKKNALEIDAMILWILKEEFGFGLKRLKAFHDAFAPSIDNLVQRYEMDDSDAIWLCIHKLKEFGVDIEQWNRKEEM